MGASEAPGTRVNPSPAHTRDPGPGIPHNQFSGTDNGPRKYPRPGYTVINDLDLYLPWLRVYTRPGYIKFRPKASGRAVSGTYETKSWRGDTCDLARNADKSVVLVSLDFRRPPSSPPR